MYWKSSKNFVDPAAYHIRDSICITDVTDPVFKYHGWLYPHGHFLGPAGAFTFRMRNVSFVGDPGFAGALSAGQHCLDGGSGGPCNVQYLLENVSFQGVPLNRRYLNHGVHAKPSAEVLPIFLAKDDSLGGYRAVVSKYLDGFAQQGCKKLSMNFDSGFGCEVPVRRLNIWSKTTLGSLHLEGSGFDTAAQYQSPVLGQNAGFLRYADGYNGYGGLAVAGQNYKITVNFSGDVWLEFSERLLSSFFQNENESIHVVTNMGECNVSAAESHGLFYGRFGPVRGASHGSCRTALGYTCRTVVKGNECWPHMAWAKAWGISVYRDMFPGLTPDASMFDIQMFFYLTYQGNCPEPCPPDADPSLAADQMSYYKTYLQECPGPEPCAPPAPANEPHAANESRKMLRR